MSTYTSEIRDLINRVNLWARENASNDYMYGSPQSYFAVALSRNVISRADYDIAEKYYGNLWTYRGD